jgi:hypothetical protein
MGATPIQHADGAIKAGNHQINICNQRVRRRSVLEFVSILYANFVHLMPILSDSN